MLTIVKRTVREEDLKIGDVVNFWCGRARVVELRPYTGPLKGCFAIAETDMNWGWSLWTGQTVEVERAIGGDL